MLRWRLFGIRFAIHPSFWLMNALMAYILYRPLTGAPENGQLLSRDLLVLMVIWILCSLVAVIVHELGHVITGRVFGQPGDINVTGLGGQAVGGYAGLSPWKRIVVIFAGPCAGFLFVAALTAVDGRPWAECMDWLSRALQMPVFEKFKCDWFLVDWVNKDVHVFGLMNPRSQYATYNLTILILFSINLFVNIMNLLPIIPMDGGMIFKEVCCIIAPRSGLKIAFGCSFLLAASLFGYLLLVVLTQYKFITAPFPLYYPFAFPEFSTIIFGMMAYQSLQAYRQLSAMERHSLYIQDD
jgi:Zn-dependent protease